RYREALNPLLEAHQLGPGDTNSGLALAQTQVKLGQGNAALETLATVADVPEKQRKNHHKLLALAVDLSDSRRAAQARSLIEQALAVDRSSKALWVALAEVADRTNRTDEKFSALAKAFELDPSDAEVGRKAVHVAIAMAQLPEMDHAGTFEWYRKAAEVGKPLATKFPTSENLMRVGEAEMKTHQYQDAVNRFEKRIKQGADGAWVRFYLGSSYKGLEDYETALEHLDVALSKSPEPDLAVQIHSARGWSYRGQENFDLAAQAFRDAGESERAEEMAGYAKNRKEWAQAKADCVSKRTQIAKMRQDSDGLEGTAEWDELNREFDEVLAACKPYFEDKT
ncbi:MAG: tetratricopeptide repeat protein, partial [Acidobacteriota bacterium]